MIVSEEVSISNHDEILARRFLRMMIAYFEMHVKGKDCNCMCLVNARLYLPYSFGSGYSKFLHRNDSEGESEFRIMRDFLDKEAATTFKEKGSYFFTLSDYISRIDYMKEKYYEYGGKSILPCLIQMYFNYSILKESDSPNKGMCLMSTMVAEDLEMAEEIHDLIHANKPLLAKLKDHLNGNGIHSRDAYFWDPYKVAPRKRFMKKLIKKQIKLLKEIL